MNREDYEQYQALLLRKAEQKERRREYNRRSYEKNKEKRKEHNRQYQKRKREERKRIEEQLEQEFKEFLSQGHSEWCIPPDECDKSTCKCQVCFDTVYDKIRP